MYLSRRALLAVFLVAGAVAAWTMLHPERFEVAVLRTFDDRSDSFTSLWVLEDAESDFLWVRAHRPDRRWLERLRANPSVELRREGRSARYQAQIFDDDGARRYVASGFRTKYGPSDLLRELTQGEDTVPVRLRPR